MAKYSSGLQIIIDTFSSHCTYWMNNGGKSTCYMGHAALVVSDHSVTIDSGKYILSGTNFWTGAAVYGFQEEELALFCQRNNFTYRISIQDNKFYTIQLRCKGRAILLESELLDQWRLQKQAERDTAHYIATKLIPLAEKFYHSDVFRMLTDDFPSYTDSDSSHAQVTPGDFTYEGFILFPEHTLKYFSLFGYRDLANDDELVAFVLACTAKYYGLTPGALDPMRLEPIKIVLWVGKPTIRFLPKYAPPQPVVKSNPLPKKDFF